MSNDRNAGRKPIITEEQIDEIKDRYRAGERLSDIAEEYGVSRQALYKRLKKDNTQSVKMDYVIDGELVAEIDTDFRNQRVHVVNYAVELSKLPFGIRINPSWQDFCEFLEREYLLECGLCGPGKFLIGDREKSFGIGDLQRLKTKEVSLNELPVFYFRKKDIIYTRTDTDGFQMKALSSDRKYFVKTQAILSGVEMRDWAVEVIASDLAGQLGIPCVKQHHCRCVFGKRTYDAVYSDNFELDGMSFHSFESLLESKGLSTREDDFIKKSAIEKLKWCARMLSEIGALDYDETLKYMLDLAVLDCLVGNVDRHTRNFGLFFNTFQDRFCIPLIFDNGMGLFEHDYYRDKYESFDDAMNNVYVSPYGEDPFEMLKMLNDEFRLKTIYKGIDEIRYPDVLNTEFAKEYERRMRELWRKLD